MEALSTQSVTRVHKAFTAVQLSTAIPSNADIIHSLQMLHLENNVPVTQKSHSDKTNGQKQQSTESTSDLSDQNQGVLQGALDPEPGQQLSQ